MAKTTNSLIGINAKKIAEIQGVIKEYIKSVDEVLKKLDEISSREKLLIDLVKQLYSDLEIVNLTNPNRNDALKEFFKKRIIGEDD